MKLPHKIVFWSHLLAGVIAGGVIFIMSATGFVVMYERQLVEFAERDMRQVAAPGAGAQRLSLDDLVAKVREQNPKAQVTGIVLRNEPTASVAVGFGRDGATYVNPYTGAVLGKESKLHDWFHDIIEWHRWLGTEGEGRATGRAITGACNLAFFWLAVTGVYLWWPRSWHWRGLKSSLVFNRYLRGKARDWNWHNVIGFWSSSVLVVLTLTAAVMSYPWANDLLYTLTGSEPPRRAESPANAAGQSGRARGGRGEGRTRAPMASFDVLMTRAQGQVPGWELIMLRLPPRGDGPITASILGPDAFHSFQRSQLTLNHATGDVVKWEPYATASPGRKLRTWVRGLHTGEALGFPGQTVAGLASLGGCFLVWTGFAMAWRRFRYRRRDAEDTSTVDYQTTPVVTGPAVVQNTPSINERAKELLRIEMEQANSNPTNGYAHNNHENTDANWTTALDNRDSLLILYGTVTGNAESLANKLASSLLHAGVLAGIKDMASCQPSVLKQASCALLVISTYGDGEPPDDAAPFWDGVVHGNGLDLRGVKYSVLALGNTTYDHFCKCGRDLDAALERHGAIRIHPRIDCDVDYDEPAERWIAGVRTRLTQKNGPALEV